MSDLMKLSKKKLIDLFVKGRDQNESYADQLIVEGGKRVGLEDEIKRLNSLMMQMKREYNRDMDVDKKLITELKSQMKTDCKRFEIINSAIETAAAIHYPFFDLHGFPDSEADTDTTFSMLRHFKQLVSPQIQVQTNFSQY